MRIIGHRGYHAKARENTLAAFEQAVALGVDGIETDVRLTSEGIPILFHDRCIGEGLNISDLAHDDIRKLAGYPVPTLESAVAEWDGVLWNLEIKVEAALDAVVEIVRRYQRTRRFLITSFVHRVVTAILDRVDVEGGLVFAHMPLSAGPFDQLAPNRNLTTLVWDFEACDGDVVRKSREKGFKNAVYGPITLADHQNAVTWKVDEIITDFPQTAMRVRG